METNEVVEFMKDYEEKENQYRKMFYGKIKDEVINGIHVNDWLVFPREWFTVYDYALKKKMLEKSIETKKSLRELGEMDSLVISSYEIERKIKI